MQNRLNDSNAEHNDTAITVHLQDSSYLVLFLTNNWVFGAEWLIEIKIVYSMVVMVLSIAAFSWIVWQIQTEIDSYH